jgi:dTDP-D-glucose 4,6-dehydratase
VEDVAEAFDTVLHKGELGEVYNIGTEKERSVLDVSVICGVYYERMGSTQSMLLLLLLAASGFVNRYAVQVSCSALPARVSCAIATAGLEYNTGAE